MENKLYPLFFFFLFTCFQTGNAQDSTICNPRFTVSVTHTTASFQAIDTHAGTLHNWSFGDSAQSGFSSSFSAIQHNYANSGTYLVTHYIKDSLGTVCFDSGSQYISVNVTPACQVSFQSEKDSVNFHIYNFFSSTVNAGGPSDSLFWYVNDTLAGTGPTLLHRYFAVGTFTVCVRLRTGSGCTAQQCSQIYVANPDSSTCIGNPSFGYIVDSSNSQRLRFSPSPDSSKFMYLWDFGDGSSSTARKPAHLFATGGLYLVTLKITRHSHKDSCSVIFSQAVYAVQRDTCKVSFTYTSHPTQTNKITFHAQNAANLDSVTWTLFRLSDSTVISTLTGNHPSYIFRDPGCYQVIMIALKQKGCTGSSSTVICIDSIPGASNNFIASYPNPVTSLAYLDLDLPANNTIYISIFNSMGNQLSASKVAGTKGRNHISVPTAGLPTGLYYIQIQYGNEIRKSKIQKW
ncbi:T9SS type A sorting domain-containing protein [Flavitalea flava]